jgi:hypothetical protein
MTPNSELPVASKKSVGSTKRAEGHLPGLAKMEEGGQVLCSPLQEMKVWLTNQSLLRMFYLRHQWAWRDRVRKLDQHQQRGIQPVPQSTKRLLIQWQDGWQSRPMKSRSLVYVLKPRTPATPVLVKMARSVRKGIRYSHRERYVTSLGGSDKRVRLYRPAEKMIQNS